MDELKKKLDQLIARKQDEVERKRAQRPIHELEAAGAGRRSPLSLAAALSAPGVSLIVDLKRQSFGQQTYRAEFEPARIARICADHGAAAVSVLIDESFGGSSIVCEEVASSVGGLLPIVYKEFIIDPYQVVEAYALGADAVLIIARPETDPATLRECIRRADALGMDAMVEIFAAESGRQALAAGARIIGINNRDYPNTTINVERAAAIRGALPPAVLSVSESGLKSAADVRRAGELGYDAVLIGEAILTAPDVASKVRELSEAGRGVSVKKNAHSLVNTEKGSSMYFLHSDEIWNAHPNFYALTIAADGVRGMKDDSRRLERLTAAVEARLVSAAESEMPEIAAWREAFSRMGLKPTQYRSASEALLRRYRKEHSMPSFHPLVDYLNYVSMAFAIPIAAYDGERISGGITVRLALGSETYVTFQGEIEHPAPGETIFADEAGNAHARRWTHRQSAKSVVTAKTDRVLIVAEAMHAAALRDILPLEQELREALTEAGVRISTSKTLTPTDRRFEF